MPQSNDTCIHSARCKILVIAHRFLLAVFLMEKIDQSLFYTVGLPTLRHLTLTLPLMRGLT